MPKSKKSKHSPANSNNDGSAVNDGAALINLIQKLKFLKSDERNLKTSYILDKKNKLIFSVQNVFTKKECMLLINFAEGQKLERATQRQSKYYAFRDNHRLQLYSQEFANTLFERIRPSLPKVYQNKSLVGLNSNIRFYRYGKSQRFGPHIDQSEIDQKNNCQSMFTVLFYLNDSSDSDLKGGETVFYTSDSSKSDTLVYKPVTGSVLIHGHGEHCLTHEGAEVFDGLKYILRTDVMYSL